MNLPVDKKMMYRVGEVAGILVMHTVPYNYFGNGYKGTYTYDRKWHPNKAVAWRSYAMMLHEQLETVNNHIDEIRSIVK
jgi:hypothetical protein